MLVSAAHTLKNKDTHGEGGEIHMKSGVQSTATLQCRSWLCRGKCASATGDISKRWGTPGLQGDLYYLRNFSVNKNY